MTLPGQHADLLASYGATAAEIEELLAYNRNVFDRSVDQAPTLPLPTEPHVAVWERYAREAAEVGAFAALRRRLVQLRFPIREGISKTDAYRAATLRGAPTEEMTEASGLGPRAVQTICGSASIRAQRARYRSLLPATGRTSSPWCAP